MKPAPFEYYAPDTLGEAVDLLRQLEDVDAKVIAGGQSLVPLMNLRLARPGALVDLRRVSKLRTFGHDGRTWTLGALVRHAEVEDSPDLRTAMPVIPVVAGQIGYRAIRNRGTVGGSICHADPAAEWPLLVVLLEANLLLKAADGERIVPSDRFFEGFMTTAVRTDEVLAEIRFDVPKDPWRWGFTEFTRAAGDFAVSAVGVIVEVTDGVVTRARVAAAGQRDVPVRLSSAEAVLVGSGADDTEVHRQASIAAMEDVDPIADGNGSADYKRTLLRVQVTRALARLASVGGAP